MNFPVSPTLPRPGGGGFWRWAACFLVVVGCLGCAGPTIGHAGKSSSNAAARGPQPTLIIAIRVEPNALTTKVLQSAGDITLNGTRGLFNANLVMVDGAGVPGPQLAEELPTLHSDNWKVLPDGRMETTYRLRSGLTWHDGDRLTSDDFLFTRQVYATSELGVAGTPPQSLMEGILTPDEQTLIIQWRQPYGDAANLGTAFPPLPRHVLGPAYEARTPGGESFVSQPFWTSGYVGLGPYSVRHWEPGAYIEAEAFDNYVFGRPRIDRVKLAFINDADTVVANLLAGAVQLTFDDAIRFEQGAVLKNAWTDSRQGSVILYPLQVRYTEIQLKPDLVQPFALTDVRVRKALAHAVDKQALIDGLLGGVGLPADTIVSPRVDYFDQLNRTVAKHPLDPRATQQLMIEAGFGRDASGFFVNSGARFAPELRVRTSTQYEAELAIMVDSWRRAGIAANSYMIPAAQALDSVVLATFPGLSTTSRPAVEEQLLNLRSSQIPNAQNRWSGSNRGGWINLDYDRLAESFAATLDRNERNQQVIEMMRIFSQDLPGLFLYYNEQTVATLANLRGPAPIAPTSIFTWNAHTWEWA